MREPSVSPLRSLVAILVLGIALAAGLAGCAKKSSPLPPPGVPDTYHQPYPSE